MTTAIYLRHSSEDKGDSIAGQRALCCDWLQRNGIGDFEEYAEDRQSAYKKRMTERPEWARLETDIRAGRITHVVARHVDRLTRSMLDLEHLVSLVETTGVTIDTVWSGDLDLNTPSGRQIARIMASVAQGESETKSQRILAAKARSRAAGRSTGGGRPFGYESLNGGLREDEAELIRAALLAIIDGVSLHGATKMFQESGIATPRGGYKWHKGTVKRILLRWRNAGRVEHQGEDIGPAVWPAIVDLDTLTAVRAVLLDEERGRKAGTGYDGGPRAATLLSGLLTCGVCGGTLKARSAGSKRGARYPVYACTGQGCYLSLHRDVLDDMAVTAMVRFWMNADVAEYAPDDRTRDELIRVQGERAALADQRQDVAQMLGDGLMAPSDARAALEGIAKRSEALEQTLETLQRRYALASALAVPVVVDGTVNLSSAGALVEHFKTQHLDIQRRQVEQTWRITAYPYARGAAQTVEVNGREYRESVSERRRVERRVTFECRLAPHLSVDPLQEDVTELVQSIAEGLDN